MARATDWETAYLRALGAPNTQRNREFLASWQRWEGGHTNNDARWNYLNTTQRMPGSKPIPNNSYGVQSYNSLRQGAQAFARTLRNGKYRDIVQALRAGDPYSHNITAGLSTWLSGSPSSPHGAEYASKILGTRVQAPPPSQGGRGAPVNAQSPFGPAPLDLSAGRMDVINQIASGGHYDPFHSLQALTASLMSQGHLTSAPDPALLGPLAQHPQPVKGAAGDWRQYVALAKGADRPGVETSQAVLQFVGHIGRLYGHRLTIATGTNHNEYVVGTQRQSAHWTGRAADIPASGRQLTRLGQQALIAAGMPRKQALKQKGGLYNVNGFQIIFNSDIGGNHYNHLHVGLH